MGEMTCSRDPGTVFTYPMKGDGIEPFKVCRMKPFLPVLQSRTKEFSGSATDDREGCTHTCTGGLRARPSQVGLTYSGRATL